VTQPDGSVIIPDAMAGEMLRLLLADFARTGDQITPDMSQLLHALSAAQDRHESQFIDESVVTRVIYVCRQRMEAIDPTTDRIEYRQLFTDLVALERYRKALVASRECALLEPPNVQPGPLARDGAEDPP